jgi:hypothetical protein
MYQLQKDSILNQICAVNKTTDNGMMSIPICADNTDYANFKKEVLAGAELQDDTGNVMTDASAYIASLP